MNDSQVYVLRPSNRIHARSPRAADCGVVHFESAIAASAGLDESVLETDLRRETTAIHLAALSAFDVVADATSDAAVDRTGHRRSVFFVAGTASAADCFGD